MKRFKHLLFLFIVLILLLPVVQKSFSLKKEVPLKGAIVPALRPVYSKQAFFTGGYQELLYKYIEEHIGFRNTLIRLNNQLSFSIFNISLSPDVVVGRNKYLYEPGYINEYLGSNFKGKAFWNKQSKIIKSVQNALKLKGVDLLIVVAPGKATVFPEYIPERYSLRQKHPTNTNIFSQYFAQNDINYINFDPCFLSMKDSARYPLYPQCGTHWSHYGALIAMDSIIRYIEKLKARKMVNVSVDSVLLTGALQEPDYDLGWLMNLAFPIPHYKMAYPKVSYHADSTVYKPRVITIGDSYYWNLFTPGITANVYREERFWFYFKKEFTNYLNSDGTELNKQNLKKDILSQDIIIILCTDANLDKIGFGFFDEAYKIFCE